MRSGTTACSVAYGKVFFWGWSSACTRNMHFARIWKTITMQWIWHRNMYKIFPKFGQISQDPCHDAHSHQLYIAWTAAKQCSALANQLRSLRSVGQWGVNTKEPVLIREVLQRLTKCKSYQLQVGNPRGNEGKLGEGVVVVVYTNNANTYSIYQQFVVCPDQNGDDWWPTNRIKEMQMRFVRPTLTVIQCRNGVGNRTDHTQVL